MADTPRAAVDRANDVDAASRGDDAGASARPAAPLASSPDPQRLHLWFEQFRDMAILALTLAGGAITLLGAGVGAFIMFAVKSLMG